MDAKYFRLTDCEIYFSGNKLWFTQKQISKLFGRSSKTINEHTTRIRADKPLSVKKIPVKGIEGSRMIKRIVLAYDSDFVYSIGVACREYGVISAFADECALFEGFHFEYKIVPLKEKRFAKMIEHSLKDICLFKTQYKILDYRIDFYNDVFNMAIEYDEKFHNKRPFFDNDREREKEITAVMPGIKFIRIAEGQEMQGLNQIIKHIFNKYPASYQC